MGDVQKHNLNSQLIGTGEFNFAEGFLTPTAALGKGFKEFGNIDAFSLQTNSDTKVIPGSYRGLKREQGTRVTLARFGYELTLNEFRADLIRYIVYGDPAAGNYTQVVRTAATVDAIASPAIDLWYDLLISGASSRNATVVAITPASGTLVENVDFVIDYVLCRMRWITTPVTLTSITLTCAAIVSTDALALKASTPLVTPIRRGMGRLTIWDRIGAVTDLVYDHKDFYCEVMASGNVNVDGTNLSEFKINVKVLTPFGTIYDRE